MTESLPVAVVGCGQWGRNLVRNFARLTSPLVVCDADAELARTMAGTHGGRALSWPEILADAGIPAVVLASPAARHGQMAWDALTAGKHVFVEKPLALKLDEATAVCALAERRHRILMVGHLLQYHPAFVALKALVRQGELGRIQYIYSNRLNLGRFRKEENILWSFAPHDVSMILSLVGPTPIRVTAVGASYLHPTIADVTTTHLTFADGTCAHVHVSWLHPFREQKLVVIGDRAMAVFDDGLYWSDKLTLFRHRIDWHDGLPEANKGKAEPVPLTADEPLKLECQHFLDCIRSGKTPRTDGREALAVLRVLHAAEQSIAERAAPAGGSVQGAGSVQGQQTDRSAGAEWPGASIHDSAFIDPPCTIGDGTRIWHFSHVLKGSVIGRNCTIGQNVVIGPDVTIGDGCKIQNNVSLYPGVTLEDDVFCGPSCVFTNVINPRAEIRRMNEARPTLVRRGATIGANATILCGVTLDRSCFIGAGAVVTRDVPAYALMVGTPARRIGWMSRAGGRLGADLVCPIDGSRYREINSDQLVALDGEETP